MSTISVLRPSSRLAQQLRTHKCGPFVSAPTEESKANRYLRPLDRTFPDCRLSEEGLPSTEMSSLRSFVKNGGSGSGTPSRGTAGSIRMIMSYTRSRRLALWNSIVSERLLTERCRSTRIAEVEVVGFHAFSDSIQERGKFDLPGATLPLDHHADANGRNKYRQ